MSVRTFRAIAVFCAASTFSVLLSSTSAIAQQQVPFAGDRVVTVMTRNVYHGVDAEFAAVPTATDFPDLLQKVAEVYQGYFTRNFPERAMALAAEIEAERPDLVALQEAILVRTQVPPDGPTTPASTVALDYLEILLDALAARGLHYEVAVQSFNSNHELPSALGFDVRQTDRVVILARTDLTTADLKVSNAQGGIFATNCTIPTNFIGPVTISRGWVAVDVAIRGKAFRLINTHLDAACLPFTSAIQQAQAAELLAGPAATDLPVVLAGDLNSPGDGTGATYNNLIGAGFVDAAVEAGVGSIPTCCQAPDLLNPASILDRRSDYVLSRTGFTVLAADIVGDDSEDRTTSGLWPSDHAGVVVRFQLPARSPTR
jgi:endonuclease/exonuclease/phosphatase family metal-dependent hydrolase